MARRTKAEAERTRLRIIKTSLDEFLRKGYERTTFEDVAGRIGLTKGAVYYHFKSKPELLVAVAEHMRSRHGGVFEGMSKAGSLEELRDVFVAQAEQVLGNAEARKFFVMMTRLDWSSSQAKPLRLWIARHDKGLLAEMKSLLEGLKNAGRIKKEVDTGIAATVLTSLWVGLVKAKLDHGAAVDLPAAIRFGFDLAVAGMGK